MAELVEGARLEIVFAGNRNEGSNPSLSAILSQHLIGCVGQAIGQLGLFLSGSL